MKQLSENAHRSTISSKMLSAWAAALMTGAMGLAVAQSPPPGGMGAGRASAGSDNPNEARSNTPNYFLASQVDWVPLLPAPPKAGSPEQQRDIQAVLDAQAAARKNPARRQQAIEDSDGGCFHYADVLGKEFDEKKLTKTAEFLKKASSDGGSAAGSVKNYWQRPRPYVVSDKVEKLADMDPAYVKKKAEERKAKEEQEKKEKAAKDAAEGKVAKAAPPAAEAKPVDPEEEKKAAAERQKNLDNTSFPSGHSTAGTLCAIFLTQMLPEKQAELYARAELYRESRLIVGAHHRTDVEAGKLLATAVAAVMSQNFAFQRDEAEARVELRTALGLPAALPERKKEEKKEESEKK
ncbi:MAG: phosphatase PAP2 family protein [Steroidobacteraceae bacterium]